jgi:predicted enzyme related to lactoylglutathione lyase/uncharacterized protein YciI
MKRLIIMAMAMCMMCLALLTAAQAQDTEYYVAYGELNEEAMANPDNALAFAGHIKNMGKLYEEGYLAMAGPFDDGTAGLIILKAASLEEAKQLLMADPAIGAGVIKPVWIRPFHAFFNKLENKSMSMEEFSAMMSEGGEAMGESHGSAAASAAAGAGGPVNNPMDMMPGAINFIQFPTADAGASASFYQTVFGWEIMPDADHGMTFFTAPGGMMGEFSTMSKPAAAMTGPVFFINTPSVKAVLPNVTAAGGKVYQEEMALPDDWGHIAIIGDSSGNAVGIWSAGE